MKKVFRNSTEVIHLFAQRTQKEARCSNVFFEHGTVIYSYGYHYELGRFVKNKKGQEAIIINDSGYSKITSKHIGEIMQATRQYQQFYKEQINPEAVKRQLQNAYDKLSTARKPEKYIEPAKYLYQKFEEYNKWAGNRMSQFKEINQLYRLITADNFKEAVEKRRKQIAKEFANRQKIQEKLLKEAINKFYAYEIDYLYGVEKDHIRLSQSGDMVETSQRIKVPVKEAQTLYKLILAKKDIIGFQIGGYTVISINGVLKIGCHHIDMDSVHKVGQQILNYNQ